MIRFEYLQKILNLNGIFYVSRQCSKVKKTIPTRPVVYCISAHSQITDWSEWLTNLVHLHLSANYSQAMTPGLLVDHCPHLKTNCRTLPFWLFFKEDCSQKALCTKHSCSVELSKALHTSSDHGIITAVTYHSLSIGRSCEIQSFFTQHQNALMLII